jgi:hypothetical protein
MLTDRMRCLFAACLVVALQGCQKTPELAPPSTAPSAGVQLEIRYNAIRALAYRGSDAMKDPDRLEMLGEMLDEQKQQQNFRVKLKNGQEIPDLAEARATVESALKAIAELHRRRPEIDLSSLYPAVEKLTNSQNEVVRQEAKKTKIALNLP